MKAVSSIVGYCSAAAIILTSSGSSCMVAARSSRPDKLAACVRRTRGEASMASVSCGVASAAAGAAGIAHGRLGSVACGRFERPPCSSGGRCLGCDACLPAHLGLAMLHATAASGRLAGTRYRLGLAV
ncbi:hypothetical protein D3C78_1337230 [compost metagenome]